MILRTAVIIGFGLLLSVHSLKKRTTEVNIQPPKVTTACLGIRLRNQMTWPFNIAQDYWHKFQQYKDEWKNAKRIGNNGEDPERQDCFGYEFAISLTHNNDDAENKQPQIVREETTGQTPPPSESDVGWEALKQTVVDFLQRARRSYRRQQEWVAKQLAYRNSNHKSKISKKEYLKMLKWWLRNRP